MKPLEFVYFQLINGKMYPTKIVRNRLRATPLPLMDGVTNGDTTGAIEPQTLDKTDTVTPKFSIEEDED